MNEQPTPAISPHVLEQEDGFQVRLSAQGAAITGIRVPTPSGPVEAVLDYPEASLRARDPFYLGSTVGRFANRIAKARLSLEGRRYALLPSPNGNGHTLHGGPEGFSHRHWELAHQFDKQSISFVLESRDGDQGFPGALRAQVQYALLDGWRLQIMFTASCTSTTVINLANHAYFNLNRGPDPASNHELWINADRFTPVTPDLIPTGELREVAGSPFDFRHSAAIGTRQALVHEQLERARGFDHNFVLNTSSTAPRLAATLRSPESGLQLNLSTTQPALQLYAGQHLSDPFRPHQGVCLEAQHFPDAPNQMGFPDTTLHPGETYRQVTEYAFCLHD